MLGKGKMLKQSAKRNLEIMLKTSLSTVHFVFAFFTFKLTINYTMYLKQNIGAGIA